VVGRDRSVHSSAIDPDWLDGVSKMKHEDFVTIITDLDRRYESRDSLPLMDEITRCYEENSKLKHEVDRLNKRLVEYTEGIQGARAILAFPIEPEHRRLHQARDYLKKLIGGTE
jgi:hypothetical protein